MKLRNFCINNFTCPWFIKKRILNACIDSTILYGCETWSHFNSKEIETVHRKAIKCILGIKDSTNNEVAYLDSGISNLLPIIRSRQWNFWQNIMLNYYNDTDNSINKVITLAISRNLRYITHYKNCQFSDQK